MTRILCIITGGAGDGRRARRLMSTLPAEITYYDVDKNRPRRESFQELRALLQPGKWDLVFQEGTGIVGGLNLIRAGWRWGQPYVISSGDPIGGFFRTTRGPIYGAAFSVYERLLYRFSSAFVGWTPYLAGLALQLGAPRTVTIEGAVDLNTFVPFAAPEQKAVRAQYGIPEDHLVCGVVGSLTWSSSQQYCYGLELVEAIQHVQREDLTIFIVGDGDGRAVLERRIPSHLKDRVIFAGRVPAENVVEALNAMDIGFITQTLDGLGSFRLTTKLPEYLAAGLPVAMSPIPGFYDYLHDAGWALPAAHPASLAFHKETAAWLDSLSHEEIAQKAKRSRALAETHFDYETVILPRFQAFMVDLLGIDPALTSEEQVMSTPRPTTVCSVSQ